MLSNDKRINSALGIISFYLYIFNYDILLIISILISVVRLRICKALLIFNCESRYRNIKYNYY